jgi:hypothetical protein
MLEAGSARRFNSWKGRVRILERIEKGPTWVATEEKSDLVEPIKHTPLSEWWARGKELILCGLDGESDA